ncbi:MAG: hypothetical protein HY299_02355 [Verrucomicrobia bacterium]|nr:hypothetical protein [Verrucomicrobiota bacterium]
MDPIRIIEWILFSAPLLGAAFWLRSRSPQRAAPRWGLLLGVGAAFGAALMLYHRQTAGEARAKEFKAKIQSVGRPGGFVTSDSCQSCHPSQYKSWHDSYHRTMTQYASPESIQADFDQVRLRLGSEEMRVWREGSEFWAELPDPEWKALKQGQPAPGPTPIVKRRIGLLTGSHHMQVFWIPSAAGNQQIIFPFSWLIEDRRWAPVHSTFLRDPTMPLAQHVWNGNCLKCHVTAGQPRADPALRKLDTRMGDLGISCEACHGPAEEHVRWEQNPLHRLGAGAADRSDARIVNPSKLPKERSAHVCGQCHGIKWIPAKERFNEEGFSFRPGQDLNISTPIVRPTHWREQAFLVEGMRQNPRLIDEHYWPDGMALVSGRDFSGTVESPCFQGGNMTCLSCHSMHSPVSSVNQMAQDRESNNACLQCHAALRGQEERHSHHRGGSAGNECYNCHMPHTTYGLLKAIRSHQISSPTVAASLDAGRPNACNLCHLDRSLEWTADQLKTWYGQPKPEIPAEHRGTAASIVWAVEGDAGQRALMAWHFGWEPAQAISRSDWMPPYLGLLMTDPYSAVRYISQRSLKRLPAFQAIAYDYLAAPADWTRARDEVHQRWKGAASKPNPNPLLMIPLEGGLDAARLEAMLARRNHRSMDLQE